MESAVPGRSTAATDGVDDGRRFNPNHPPPHGGVADAAPSDMAALLLRKAMLLLELQKGRMFQDMIMRELTETERAIDIATGNRSTPTPVMPPWPPRGDVWRGSVAAPASREEQLPCAPPSSETTTPWWCRSPSEPVVPPVYPHVERSPSPVPRQQRLVDDNFEPQQERRGGPSGPPAVAPSALPGFTPGQPLIKEPASTVEESSIPALTNAVVKPVETDLLSKEATQEDQAAVGQQREAEGENSNRVQVMESGIQRSEQPGHASVGKEPKAEAMDGDAVQLMQGSGIHSSGQPNQEMKREVKDSHAVQLMQKSGIQSSEPSKLAEPTTELRRSPGQHTLGGPEFNENFPLKRRLLTAPVIPSPEKKLKPQERSGRTFSRVNTAALRRELRVRREAQPNLPWPPQPMQKPAGPATTLPAPESSHDAHHHQQSSGEKTSQNLNQNVVSLGATGGSNTSKGSGGDIGQARAVFGFDPTSHFVPDGGRRRQDQNTVVASSSSWSHAEGGGGDIGQARAVFGFDFVPDGGRRRQDQNTVVASSSSWSHAEGGGGNNGGEQARRVYHHRKAEDQRKTLATKKRSWQHDCVICNVHCSSKKTLESHLAGKKHREMMLQGRQH